MITMTKTALADWHDMPLAPSQIACWWLGQAGFLFRHEDICFIIDPYLSDSLAIKYQDADFKHTRMMPVPIESAELTGIQWVFCTHKHTDHMDGETLSGLANANPGCQIMAPMAAEKHLCQVIGMDQAKVTLVDAGIHLELSPHLAVDVLASAHEDLEYDAGGHSICLGYIIDVAGTRLYHSGDCVPYQGLAQALKGFDIDVALLPVNGRDAVRAGQGVPGNFHFDEAVSLCCEAGINTLVPHHFGMFDFNTADSSVWPTEHHGLNGHLQIIVPQIDQALLIVGNGSA